MFVITTSKPGQFHTEIGEGFVPLESYDYRIEGRTRAHFVISRLDQERPVRVIDETEPICVNVVPPKFLERFDTVDAARKELQHLCQFGRLKAELVRTDSATAGKETP